MSQEVRHEQEFAVWQQVKDEFGDKGYIVRVTWVEDHYQYEVQFEGHSNTNICFAEDLTPV